jgi:hypothetical protein
MNHVVNACKAALLAAVMFAAGPAFAAAPDALDPDPATAPAMPSAEFKLDTVLIVHNWVLCVSQPSAEAIARARVESAAAADKVYADLATAKSCGKFPKLGVMLQKQLFPQIGQAADPVRVFSAQVNIGVGWQNAFVVSSDVPEAE